MHIYFHIVINLYNKVMRIVLWYYMSMRYEKLHLYVVDIPSLLDFRNIFYWIIFLEHWSIFLFAHLAIYHVKNMVPHRYVIVVGMYATLP